MAPGTRHWVARLVFPIGLIGHSDCYSPLAVNNRVAVAQLVTNRRSCRRQLALSPQNMQLKTPPKRRPYRHRTNSSRKSGPWTWIPPMRRPGRQKELFTKVGILKMPPKGRLPQTERTQQARILGMDPQRGDPADRTTNNPTISGL